MVSGNNKYDKIKFDKLSIRILIISCIVILFSFIAPLVFIQESLFGLDFTKTGQIGDTIGGIMNPFIAIVGVLITFLAFYIQFRANEIQRQAIRTELDQQKEQFKKSQFENQFYEMLRLHKENANEFSIDLVKNYFNSSGQQTFDSNVRGRKVFDYLIKEFEICYYAAKKYFPDSDIKALINEAYGVFFHGLNEKLKDQHVFYKTLFRIKNEHKGDQYERLSATIKLALDIDWKFELKYSIFDGYSSQLAHYYRHLFQTVKFIVNQDDTFISYEEKRNYLRMLRAQLSNQEQALLFYNWLSKFGNQWENETNKFFTDYRMIHNIYQQLIIPDVKLNKLFDLDGDYKKEKNRSFDSLFESQDW